MIITFGFFFSLYYHCFTTEMVSKGNRNGKERAEGKKKER